MTYYLRTKYEPSDFPGWDTIGPYETREEAEAAAAKYIGRPGWEVEIIEKDEPFYRDFV